MKESDKKMRIPGDINRITGAYDKIKRINEIKKTDSVTKRTDEVSFSETAKDYQIALNALNNTPDIRQEKVVRLKKAYESGNYDIKGSVIAEKLINSPLFDKKV